jgi:hypothetical protein
MDSMIAMKFQTHLLVNALQFENDWPCAIVATGDHDFLIVSPATHDGTTLKSGIDIAADAVPRFGTEFPVYHPEKIGAINQKLLAFRKIRTLTGLGVGEVLIGQILVKLSTNYRDFAFMYHGFSPLLSPLGFFSV